MKVILQAGDPDKLRKKYAVQYSFPELQLYHPKFHVKFVEEYILSNHRWNKNIHNQNSDIVTIITNSEHMINRLRIAHKEGEIELVIHWYPFEDKPMQLIGVDEKGELSHYPTGLLDECSNQIINNKIIMTVNDELIGRKFKRLKYEVSTFTGTITEVMVVFENYSKPFKHEIPHIKIKSENGIVYSLNEIVLV